MSNFKNELKSFTEKLNLDSNNIFIKTNSLEISFVQFNNFSEMLADRLEEMGVIPHNTLLMDIREPIYLLGYIFACFKLDARPALLNSFLKENQIQELQNENKFDFQLADQKKEGFNFVDTASKPSFKKVDQIRKLDPSNEIIFFSSGSVKIKACVLTLENFFFNALGSKENIPFAESDSWGLCLPLFHVGGFSIVIRAVLSCGSICILNNQNLLEDLKNLKPSHISFVSTQLMRFLESNEDYELQHILLGGSAIPDSLILKALDKKLPIYKSYGMTEMASQVCTTKILSSKDYSSFSSGYQLNYRELKISDKKIFVKGPCLFKGYLKNNKIEKPFDDHGWFFTNDLGELHNRQIEILGRIDRIFQSGGEKISPENIERELLKINGVQKAYVHPEVDSEYGLRPIAYVDKVDSLSYEDILKELSAKLPGLSRPKAIKHISESPKTSWKQ